MQILGFRNSFFEKIGAKKNSKNAFHVERLVVNKLNMIRKIIITAVLAATAVSAQARITSFGDPAKYGIAPAPENWYEINPHTWDTFVTFDDEIIFGTNEPRYTLASAECYSTGVMEGRKVGDFTAVASFVDRGSFFGGDGYLDAYYFAPVDMDRYAQQAVVFGGWKYNLTKYFDIDLGGNVIYSTKKVMGPGIVIEGLGGETMRGDVYAGFSTDKIFLKPFIYVGYDPTYDALKYQAGIGPDFDLSEITAIEGLSIETQLVAGYIRAQRFSGSEMPDGSYWRNSYAYIQMEANLVYVYKSFRIFAGVGWAIHNDGKTAPNGASMGGDNNVWTGGGIGYIF